MRPDMAERLKSLRIAPEWTKTAAASVGATLALNGLLGVTQETPTTEPSCTTVITVHNRTDSYYTYERFARNFAQDPQAGVVVSADQIRDVVDAVKKAQARGEQVTEVKDTGSSSAEDDAVDANGTRIGGFDTPSIKNKELANKRAKTHAVLVKQEAQATGTKLPAITFGEPIEGSLDPDMIKRLDAIAGANGFKSSAQLVDVYNGLLPGKLKSTVTVKLDNGTGVHDFKMDTAETLRATLVLQRYVRTDITSEVVTETEDCQETPVSVPVVVPVFKAYLQDVPTTGPVPARPVYAPLETTVNPRWTPNKPVRINQPHPQGQGPQQIKAHIARTHGGDRGLKRNYPNKNRA
jgi:hypothetical protein